MMTSDCLFCFEPAKTLCATCKRSFCSRKCIVRGSQLHRACVKMPPLITGDLKNHIEAVKHGSRFPSVLESVTVVFFASTAICVVHSLERGVPKLMDLIQSKITDYALRAPNISKKPKKARHAIVDYHNEYRRAIITSKPNSANICTVYLTDLKITERFDYRLMLKSCSEIDVLPYLTHSARLRQTCDYPIISAVHSDINRWLKKRCSLCYLNNESKLPIINLVDESNHMSLRNEMNKVVLKMKSLLAETSDSSTDSYSDSPRSLNEIMITKRNRCANNFSSDDDYNDSIFNKRPLDHDIGNSTKIVSAKSKTSSEQSSSIEMKTERKKKLELPKLKNPDIRFVKFIATDKREAYVTTNVSHLKNGLVGCAPLNYLDSKDVPLIAKILAIDLQFKDKRPYSPAINEYVMALYDDLWQRGRVEKINKINGNSIEKNTYEIYLIDLAQHCTLRKKSIRQFPDNLNYDCTTQLCKIEGLPQPLRANHVEKLKNFFLVMDLFLIDKITIDEDDQMPRITTFPIIKF